MSTGPHANVITPEVLFDLESNMQMRSAREYQRLSQDMWWNKVAKEFPSSAKKERLIWLLDTARIRRTNETGGDITFESLVSQNTEYENLNASAGLRMPRNELEDLEPGTGKILGVEVAAEWARQMGAYAAYWPQHEVAKAIKAGEASTSLAYDGLTFFNDSHPINPFKGASFGTYKNLLVGSPFSFSSSSTPTEVFSALTQCAAYVASIRMPNGDAPRKLRMKDIFVPPALMPLTTEALDAKFLARVSTSGGGSGSGDVQGVLTRLGIGMPTQADEFSESFPDGDDDAFYFTAASIGSDEVGALAYVNREPFSIIYHGPQDSAQLARIREFQWTTEGRNVVGYGHPYLLFKVRPS